MIQSEEKKKRLLELIAQWCAHTKIEQLLRAHDIPSLVGSILDEFYHVHLCCGHLVASSDEGVHIAFNDNDSVVSGLYCRECANRYKKELGAWEVKSDT